MKQEYNAIEKDPVISRALAMTDLDRESSEVIANKIIDILRTEVSDKKLDPKYGFLALSKSLAIFTQSICEDEKDFANAISFVNEKIVNNIFPALGSNHENEELNKNGKVIFNDTFDEKNFAIKTLMLISASIVDYTFWRVNYNKSLLENMEN